MYSYIPTHETHSCNCYTLQHSATLCVTLQHSATLCTTHILIHDSRKLCVRECRITSHTHTQHTATLQHSATLCTRCKSRRYAHTQVVCASMRNHFTHTHMQHTATHCNTLQHTHINTICTHSNRVRVNVESHHAHHTKTQDTRTL